LRTRKFTSGFTLAEALLAIVIVGILAALVLPIIVTNYKNKALDLAFKREKQTIENAILSIEVNESSSYIGVEDFMNKYLKISKFCSTNGSECFGEKYWTYSDGDKVEYEPTYNGSCAILKNGMSVCMTSIGAGITSNILIDLTGKKGPNVLGRDLRSFSVYVRTKDELNRMSSNVIWEPKTIEFQEKCDPAVPTEECCADDAYFTKESCCDLMPEDPRCEPPAPSCATETTKSLGCCKQDAYFTAECCELFPGSFDEAHCPKEEPPQKEYGYFNLTCSNKRYSLWVNGHYDNGWQPCSHYSCVGKDGSWPGPCPGCHIAYYETLTCEFDVEGTDKANQFIASFYLPRKHDYGKGGGMHPQTFTIGPGETKSITTPNGFLWDWGSNSPQTKCWMGTSEANSIWSAKTTGCDPGASTTFVSHKYVEF